MNATMTAERTGGFKGGYSSRRDPKRPEETQRDPKRPEDRGHPGVIPRSSVKGMVLGKRKRISLDGIAIINLLTFATHTKIPKPLILRRRTKSNP
jgi:hypothetical protein